MFRIDKLKRDEKGQTMIEFALVFLILVILVLGIVQFSMIFSGQIAVTNAAREGARAATVGTEVGASSDEAGADSIYGIVKRAIGGHGYLDISAISVSVTGNTEGEAVTVVVDNVFVETIVPVPSFDNFGPGSANIIDANTGFRLDGEASMRLESYSGGYADAGDDGTGDDGTGDDGTGDDGTGDDGTGDDGTGDDDTQEWVSGQTYYLDEEVKYDGKVYRCTQKNGTTQPPTNTGHWAEVI